MPELQFPLGGLHRGAAYQKQPPFTTPDCLNVRPKDPFEGRARGGTRPGTVKWDPLQLGGYNVSGNLNGTPTFDSSTGLSTVTVTPTASADNLNQSMVGLPLAVPSGITSRIFEVLSTTVCTVTEDVTPNTGNPAYTISSVGQPVRLLSQVGLLTAGSYQRWVDEFWGIQRANAWNTTIGVPHLRFDSDGFAYSRRLLSGHPAERASIRAPFDSFDMTTSRTIEARTKIHWGACNHTTGDKYLTMKLYLGVAGNQDNSGNLEDGIEVALTGTRTGFRAWTYTGYVKKWVSSSVAATFMFDSTGTDELDTMAVGRRRFIKGEFIARIEDPNEDGTFTGLFVSYNGVTLYEDTDLAWVATGYQCGFGVVVGDITLRDPSAGVLFDSFESIYTLAGDDTFNRRNILVAGGGATLYRDAPDGSGMAAVANQTPGIATDRLLHAVERGQILYIADNGILIEGTTGTVASSKLDDASVSDWTAHGITTHSHVVSVPVTVGATLAGVYAISAIHATDGLTLTGVVDGGAGGLAWRVERSLKKYNPSTDTLSEWVATNGGIIPSGCPLIALYRDRVVLAGAVHSPHVWYMSRQGDALDFDFSTDASDNRRAVGGTTEDAGELGEPMTALIARDDYLIFGAENSLWVLRGDPAQGGVIDNLSRTVGIATAGAYCWGPVGEILFLSRDGLFIIQAGAVSGPVSLSRDILPRDLRNIDSSA